MTVEDAAPPETPADTRAGTLNEALLAGTSVRVAGMDTSALRAAMQPPSLKALAGVDMSALPGALGASMDLRTEMARQMNDTLANARLYPRVARTAFAASALGAAEAADQVLDAAEGLTDAERAAIRPVVQIVMAVLWCAWMADIYLSPNEVGRLIQELLGSMGLTVSGVGVWKLTGKVFDALWPARKP